MTLCNSLYIFQVFKNVFSSTQESFLLSFLQLVMCFLYLRLVEASRKAMADISFLDKYFLSANKKLRYFLFSLLVKLIEREGKFSFDIVHLARAQFLE